MKSSDYVTLCNSKISLDIAPNSVRMYNLSFLFSNLNRVLTCEIQMTCFFLQLHTLQECTIKKPCFQNFLSSSNSQNTISNTCTCVTSTATGQLACLLSFFYLQFQLPKHCFKSRQKAQLSVLVFIFSQHFQFIVSTKTRRRCLATLISFFPAVSTSKTSFQIA